MNYIIEKDKISQARRIRSKNARISNKLTEKYRILYSNTEKIAHTLAINDLRAFKATECLGITKLLIGCTP